MLKFKHVRDTEKEHAHTKVFRTDIGEYLGYIMYENSVWYFTSKCNKMDSFRSRVKSEVIQKITDILSGNETIVKSGFGIEIIHNKQSDLCTYFSDSNGLYEACDGTLISNEDLTKLTNREDLKRYSFNSHLGIRISYIVCPCCGKELTSK